MNRTRAVLAGLLLATAAAGPVAATENRVYVLMPETLTAWEKKVFEGETKFETTYKDGRTVVEAKSDGTSSGYYRVVTVDLNKTPYLHWTWRVENVLAGPDERTQQGDDFPARVYAVESGGLFFWKTRAVGYVWASKLAPGTTWENPYKATANLVAVRSGAKEVGQWVTERRDVRADFKKLYGDDVTQIDAIAIYSDTDNTKGKAIAYFGPIYFASE